MNDGNEITTHDTTEVTASPTRRRQPSPSPARPAATIRDERLGPRPADVTHWRCRRVDEGGKGSPLFWGDDEGVQLSEWPITTLALDTIRERWGAGRYVVHYVRVDDTGSRVPRGRSRIFQLVGAEEGEPEIVIHAPRAPAPSAPLPQTPVPGIVHDQNFVFSMLTFLEDRADKNRNAGLSEARVLADRERAHWEAMMERDRIAANERSENLKLLFQAKASTDTDALVERVANAVTMRFQGSFAATPSAPDEDDDEDDAAPAGSLLERMIADAVKEHGPQVVELLGLMIKEKFGAKTPPAAGAAE